MSENKATIWGFVVAILVILSIPGCHLVLGIGGWVVVHFE